MAIVKQLFIGELFTPLRLFKKDHLLCLNKIACLKKAIWIGAHCVILDGVKIGTSSVIAAGAVVNKEIPQMSICRRYFGNVIKER